MHLTCKGSAKNTTSKKYCTKKNLILTKKQPQPLVAEGLRLS